VIGAQLTQALGLGVDGAVQFLATLVEAVDP
jgi:hypothetical protein